MTRFLFLRIGPLETDFRFALAEALQALGHEVAYLYLGRRPKRVDPGPMKQSKAQTRLEAILWLLTQRGRYDVVFNSTDLAFPRSLPWLRRRLGGIWVFDLHDDLRYGRGEATTIALQRRAAMHDLTICAAPSLVELVAGALCLGNASNLRPAPEPKPADRILLLASLDERFDFAFLAEAARSAPDLAFDLYGHIAGATDTAKALRQVLAECPNVRHLGSYGTDDLEQIIAGYQTMFAAFRVDHPSTRHIDPLRFHHALNAGLELITTDIPAARRHAERLHIVADPSQVGPLVRALQDEPRSRRNLGLPPLPDWRNRAAQLLALIEERRARR